MRGKYHIFLMKSDNYYLAVKASRAELWTPSVHRRRDLCDRAATLTESRTLRKDETEVLV